MKRVLSFVFSKKLLYALFVLLQLLILFALFYRFREYYPYFWGLYITLDVILILWEINREDGIDFTVAWVMMIALLPIAGALLYLFLHTDLVSYRIRRRFELEVSRSKNYLRQSEEVRKKLYETHHPDRDAFRYLGRAGGYPVWQNTAIRYYPLGDTFFPEFTDALEQAEKFIFMEFFIIADGRMWDTVRTILERKARQGVEIRLLYDGMGSLGLLPPGYPKKMQKAGIDCRIFSPIRPFLSTYQNNRDHRKICVIDGHTAFTGGVNLADEYINEKERFGHWKDVAVMLRGDGVKNFTFMFLQLWNASKRKKLDYAPYLESPAYTAPGESFVCPFGDFPLDSEPVGELSYIQILNQAKNYVHIMTPYLILSANMLSALKFAAKRGVQVTILMPHVPDKKIAFMLAHSYYPELLRAGVQIYEYTPGFVHAKLTVSDGARAVVGSINYDYRSLYLHYECGVYIAGDPVIETMEEDFKECLTQSQYFTLSDWKRLGFFHRLFGKIFRAFAPLM